MAQVAYEPHLQVDETDGNRTSEVECTGCGGEVPEDEVKFFRRKPYCQQHALMEMVQFIAAVLDPFHQATANEIREVEQVLPDVEESLSEIDYRVRVFRAIGEREQRELAAEIRASQR